MDKDQSLGVIPSHLLPSRLYHKFSGHISRPLRSSLYATLIPHLSLSLSLSLTHTHTHTHTHSLKALAQGSESQPNLQIPHWALKAPTLAQMPICTAQTWSRFRAGPAGSHFSAEKSKRAGEVSSCPSTLPTFPIPQQP
jgi:hypothetical protein